MSEAVAYKSATAQERAASIAKLTAPGQPYEIVNAELYGASVRAFANAPATLRELFAEARSPADFIVYEDERYSFAEALDTAARLGHLLVTEFGIAKGDRVAISMRNYPEWMLLFMAVTSVGGVAVAMNSLWQADELEYGLTDSGARLLFADQERLNRYAQSASPFAVQTIAVRTDGELPSGVLALPDLLGRVPADATMPMVELLPEDNATILYTSGSTGHPKGAVSCHRNIISALLSWELEQQIALDLTGATPPTPTHQPATLLAVPLFHATGSHAVYLASYRAQRKIVAMYKWDPAIAAGLIEAEKVSGFIAPAAMTGDLIEEANRTQRDLSTLQSVGGGGAPRAPEQVARIETSFANALPGTGWGMTETNAIGTAIGGQDYLLHPASSGRCSAVLDLKIVDDDGHEVATGERGEVRIRGVSIFRGYHNRPDANAEVFVDGWLRTGDVAYLNEDGFLFIVDRIKDLVIRGGENIGCGEVEAALLEHPDVLEASVYAVPDERLGEEIGATVCARAGLTEAELLGFVAQRQAKFKVPRYLELTSEQLPRIASGKIFKRQLRAQALERLGLSAD